MPSDRWRRIEQLYHEALALDPSDRSAFLRDACGGDNTLCQEIESLLAHERTAENFLGAPALGVAAQAMAAEPAIDATTTMPRSPRIPTTSDPDGPFTTGEIVAGRYRIVGLLGRGGMGEVYRADDLTLDQSVALKFLPRSLDRNPQLLERLHGEVRIARQVSHPNVCRVYDIGSAAGRHFLTMEYVDGEDLASLLRRIGRLPGDKALDIARQLCAALAAAHDRGVVHRDLKPANIMLDGHGKIRVTDFGLAVLAEETATPGDRAGTPAYMAPEQLDGAPLSARTDIYALGLVLYELFTGRRLMDAQTLDQLKKMQADLETLRLSAGDVHLDPAVERVILRCIEFDAARRPKSALTIAAVLPGGDPLAAALAAGETPSPELVAAAGDDTSLSPAICVALLVAAIAGCLISAVWNAQRSVFALLHPQYSGEVLGVKAREMLQRLRPDDSYAAVAWSFGVDTPFTRYVQQHRELQWRWADLGHVKPAPVFFWQRTSPGLLMPAQFPGGTRVSATDPPRGRSGMTLIATDLEGHLTYLDARPSAKDDRTAGGAPPWQQLFQEAGLDPARFTSAQPEWMPPMWGDARAAWTGSSAEHPNVPLRVEATSYHGRPTFFVIAAPWSAKPGEGPIPAPTAQRIAAVVLLALVATAVAAGALMVRRNLKSGRADRRGATRVTAFVAITQVTASLLVMAHVASLDELQLLLAAFAWPLIVATPVWILYVALEPYIRRTWPSALISWNRVMDGRFRDVRVARDVLIGTATTCVILGIGDPFTGRFAPLPPRGMTGSHFFTWRAASGLRETLALVLNDIDQALFMAFVAVLLYGLARMILRRDWMATTVFVLVFAGTVAGNNMSTLGTASAVLFAVAAAVAGGVFVTLLVRFGLIAAIVNILSDVLLEGVVTLNPSAWYAGSSFFNLIAVMLIAIYAGWTCLSSRRASATVLTAQPSRVAVRPTSFKFV